MGKILLVSILFLAFAISSCTQKPGYDNSFFQAKDGIRDGRVTGVQTFALPIYARCRGGGGDRHRWHDRPGCDVRRPDLRRLDEPNAVRSEERRVGKENRSRLL